jgi:hypothetical protein
MMFGGVMCLYKLKGLYSEWKFEYHIATSWTLRESKNITGTASFLEVGFGTQVPPAFVAEADWVAGEAVQRYAAA